MSKFNMNDSHSIKTTSYEDGEVYFKNPLEDWMNFLFSSYLSDKFYEDSAAQIGRFINLTKNIIDEYGADFAAKASVFARKELGMRSISQLSAAILNSEQFENKRHFFKSIANRPDDVAEIFAAIDVLGDKRSHAAVRGFSDYLSSLGDYQIGKYKMKGKRYNMFDLINITHAHSESIDKYKAHMLEAPDTWEVKIHTANDKGEEWRRLVKEGKLGYLALIRNLNHILEEVDPSKTGRFDDNIVADYLIPQITNEVKIRKSMVFPYQIYNAYRNLSVKNFQIIEALEKAFRISCSNMPTFDGKTAIVLDVSGSMDDAISPKSNITLKEIGACYGIAIWLKNQNVDMVKFGNQAKSVKLNSFDNAFSCIEKFAANDGCGYGTDIAPVYKTHLNNTYYDRIFLISDMQIMSEHPYGWFYYSEKESGKTCFEKYCRKFGNDTHMYSFDLANYNTQTDNPNNPHVHLMTSLTDKVVSMIPYVENGEKLFNLINSYSY